MIDLKSELQKIAYQNIDGAFIGRKSDIAEAFRLYADNIGRLYKKQGEMNIQLEEIYSLAAENQQNNVIESLEKENEKLIKALVFSADMIEDLYTYYENNYDEAMTAQSSVIWRTLCKTFAAAGLVRVADENTPFDPTLNSVENIICDMNINEGYIAKVLKSGYIYKNKVIRKSLVVINKTEIETETEKN